MTMIYGKINGPWNIGYWPTYSSEGWSLSDNYPKYNISLSNSLQDMKQNSWTIKYSSLTYIYFISISDVPHQSIILAIMLIHQII